MKNKQNIKDMFEKLSINNITTTVFRIKPISNVKHAPLALFVPGNPGLVSFYKDFLTTVSKSHPNYELLGISHAGFSDLSNPPNLKKHFDVADQIKHFDVADQIKHFRDILLHFHNQDKQRPIIIMGHSFGCYVTQQAILTLPELPYKKLVFFMPCVIDLNKSSSGLKLERMLYYVPNLHSVVGFIAKLLSFIPKFLILLLFQYIMKIPSGDLSNVSYSLITSKNVAEQVIYLTKYELDTIVSDWQSQKALQGLLNNNEALKGVEYWFAQSDHWISDETRQDLIHYFKDDPKTQFFISSSLKHAFPLSKSNIDYISQRLQL